MLANGSNRRGQGGAKATIMSKVSAGEGGKTKVDIDTDYSITGRLARPWARRHDRGRRQLLLREFANCLEQRLGHEQAVEESAPPADAAAAG